MNVATILDPEDFEWGPSRWEGVYLKDLITKVFSELHSVHYIMIDVGKEITNHTHKALEIIIITNGSGKAICDNDVYEIKPGSLMWTPPGVSHAIKQIGTEPLSLIAIFSPPLR